MDIHSIGPDAFVVDFATSELAISSFKHLKKEISHLLDEVILGANTMVIKPARHSGITREGIAEMLKSADFEGADPEQREVEIPTVYDGQDLDDVAAISRLSVREVIDMHCAETYVVSFIGFAPGFAYLTGLNPSLKMPRLNSPRAQVPKGSVAIAESYSAVYPNSSPGGWRLIGRTAVELWDLSATEPAILHPGYTVRFVEQ
jgi:KipI family sensor histidine kinase inhibitor